MPEPRTAQKAKVQVQFAAAAVGSAHGSERQIMVEEVKWVKKEQHKWWNKALGNYLGIS